MSTAQRVSNVGIEVRFPGCWLHDNCLVQDGPHPLDRVATQMTVNCLINHGNKPPTISLNVHSAGECTIDLTPDAAKRLIDELAAAIDWARVESGSDA